MTELAHYGVKGMRWGVRKPEESGGSKRKISRKENREMNRKASDEFYQKKAATILNAAKQGDKTLIVTRLQDDPVRSIMTGKEFTDHLAKGGAFDIRMTEIYAKQSKSNQGAYVRSDKPIGVYKKRDFRKEAKNSG